MDIPVYILHCASIVGMEEKNKALIENIDYLAVIFPFEEIFFKKYTNNVSYVGHPLFQDSVLLNSAMDYSGKHRLRHFFR